MTTTSPCALWWSTQASLWAKHTTTRRRQAKPQLRARRSSHSSEVCNQIKRLATTLRQVKRCSKSRQIKNKRIWTCSINSEPLIKALRQNPRINVHRSHMHNQLIALEFHEGLQGRCLETWLKPGLWNSNHQEEVVATLELYFRAEINWLITSMSQWASLARAQSIMAQPRAIASTHSYSLTFTMPRQNHWAIACQTLIKLTQAINSLPTALKCIKEWLTLASTWRKMARPLRLVESALMIWTWRWTTPARRTKQRCTISRTAICLEELDKELLLEAARMRRNSFVKDKPTQPSMKMSLPCLWFCRLSIIQCSRQRARSNLMIWSVHLLNKVQAPNKSKEIWTSRRIHQSLPSRTGYHLVVRISTRNHSR